MPPHDTSTDVVRLALVSLGCPKNLVDSEGLLGRLDPARFALCSDPADADVAVVNTCGFLEAARTESIETILELGRLKSAGSLRGLVVTGCLVPRHRADLERELPEVDAFLPFADYASIAKVAWRAAGRAVLPSWDDAPLEGARLPLTAAHTGWLKIAEGCDNPCSFCTIPQIRGGLRSRPIDDLVREATERAAAGAVELNLIAQDLTDWGKDLYGRRGLERLLAALGEVGGIRWLRLLYAYPAHVTPALIEEMARNDAVLPYLDMPIQHASASVLRRMKRGMGGDRLKRLFDRLRGAMPDIALRTTIIVGSPGETDEEFEELLAFLEEVRFHRLGTFPYSREDGTPAGERDDQIPEPVKEERWHRVMALQQRVSRERNEALVGTVVSCLVEEPTEEPGVWLGRTAADAPEIDGTIRIAFDRPAAAGLVGEARVTGVLGPYDLEGTWIRAT